MAEFHGVRHYYSAIPHHLQDLVDDVYRSVAGYVRKAGGFDKTRTAFAEFVWADFFRRSLPIELVRTDVAAAVRWPCRSPAVRQRRECPASRISDPQCGGA